MPKKTQNKKLYCPACKKLFKSSQQWQNHNDSKKHKQLVQQLPKEEKAMFAIYLAENPKILEEEEKSMKAQVSYEENSDEPEGQQVQSKEDEKN